MLLKSMCWCAYNANTADTGINAQVCTAYNISSLHIYKQEQLYYSE